MTNSNDSPSPKPLYERLGGESFVPIFVESFFDEFVGDSRMDAFFAQVNISCLKLHQIKFYRLMFGPEHLRPSYNDLVDYMLLTHARLFHLGMNEEHFDMIATGFVRGLQARMVDQDLIDEAVAILAPLRGLFEYGAKLAKKEETSTSGVVANHTTVEQNDMDVVLADYTMGVGEPECLKEAIGHTKPGFERVSLREWVCALAELFGIDNDIDVADYFMSMPFMEQYPYIVHFMMIALADLSSTEAEAHVQKIKYPRGPGTPALPQGHFVNMVEYFVEVCQEKGLQEREIQQAERRLVAFRKSFAAKVLKVGGINAPHCLQKGLASKHEPSVVELEPKRTNQELALEEPGPSPTTSERRHARKQLKCWIRKKMAKETGTATTRRERKNKRLSSWLRKKLQSVSSN